MKYLFAVLFSGWIYWLWLVWSEAAQNSGGATGGFFEAIIFWGSVLIGIVVLMPLGFFAFRTKKEK